MLLQRVITAVVLLIIIIGALLISPLAFTAVAAIAIGCCFWEWLRICKWNNGVAMVCGVLLAAFFFFLEYVSPEALQTVQSGNGLMMISRRNRALGRHYCCHFYSTCFRLDGAQRHRSIAGMDLCSCGVVLPHVSLPREGDNLHALCSGHRLGC